MIGGLLIIIIYTMALALIFVYCLVQFHLALKYVKWHKNNKDVETPALPEILPFVTIQLPLYNELYVTERLLESVSQIEWPKDRFEIQVLDDSTDESVDVAAKKVSDLRAKGFQVEHVQRADRKGFKAGALQYGMKEAKGEFIAIFDADFTPKPDFLLKSIPWFDNPKIGVVQTRWEHLNRDYSLLTAMQAFALDMHFSVEQLGRHAAGYFINFNGTAGIWRKKCIDDAGGWKADTLTEDMDLSYRAQLKGWKFRYLEGIGSPAELPTEMSAIKSQQFRWNKGGAETARKLAGQVLKADLPFKVKFHALSHLLNTSNYIWIFLTAVLSIPLLYVKHEIVLIDYFKYASVFLFGSIAIAYAYYVSTVYKSEDRKGAWKTYATKLPIFMAITMGLSLHNAMAVMRGWLGQESAFIRTPKFNITALNDNWKTKKYTSGKIGLMTWFEGLFALYFLGGVAIGLYYEDYGLLPFHLMAATGFILIFVYSVRHALIVPGK
ncbi:MAG: cellulose synthase/poly-beta-1,6-N-acetylglucosamine synthase-like glycosyltransferase [Limisphaerales bacterium]|jgi:cellulose synthase/poly-beta-1,6-N-acetylglucosamine synthase-like glycosyltransferase